MSYFPILAAPGCTGWTTLCNFSPNNWEAPSSVEMHVNLSWAQDGLWRTTSLGVLPEDAMRTVAYGEIANMLPEGSLPLLSLSAEALPAESVALPKLQSITTATPAWRATLGLASDKTSACYQGEVNPFPPLSSLLTFPPFLQLGECIRNYMLFLNLEAGPAFRTAMIEIYDAAHPDLLLASYEVRSNSINVVDLDGLGFEAGQLPMIICRKMTGIPLYLSSYGDGEMLSIEHTHPPASYVVHGKRWDAQKLLKNLWLAKAGES